MRPFRGVTQNAAPVLHRRRPQSILALFLLAFFFIGSAPARAGLNDPDHVFIANSPKIQLGALTVERLGSIFDAGAGPFAAARAGDWRLSNEHVAVTFASVEPTSASAINISMPTNGFRPYPPVVSYPGSILDVAVEGNSLDFVVAITQFAGLDPRGNTIVYDTVKPVQRPDALGLQFDGSPFENAPVRVRTTYWLVQGASHLTVETEILDLPPDEKPPVIGDLALWGYGTPLVNKGGEIYGTGDQKQPIETEFYQVQGANMCVALAAPEGTRLHGTCQGPPFAFNTHYIPVVKEDKKTTSAQGAPTTATLVRSGAAPTTQTVAAVQPIAGAIHRELWLTNGSLGEQLEKIQEARHVQTGRITGTVLADDGKTSVPDATILVRWSDLVEYEKKPPVIYTRLKADSEGRYSIQVPPNGFFSIIPVPKSKTFLSGSRFLSGFVPAIGKTNRINAVCDPESGVRVRVIDAATSQPLAARLRFEAIPPNAPINFGFPVSARAGYLEYCYVPPEGEVVYLPPGRWTIHAGHGIAYEMADVTMSVEPGKISEATLTLQQSSPSPGWVHMEVGARTQATPGCAIAPRDIALMCAGEGIDWVVSGDYEKLTDLRPAIAEQGLEKLVQSSRGFRTTLPAHPEWGQFLIYPVADNAPDPAQARQEWASLKTAKEFLDTLHRLYPGALIQSELPYTQDGLGYFAVKNRDPLQYSWHPATDIDTGIDAINILPSRVNWDYRSLRGFWLYNLARGRNYIPAGSSTATTVYGAEPGYPRLLAFLGKDVKPTEAAILDSLKARRVQITSGPFIDYTIDKVLPGGIIDPDPSHRVRIRVTAPHWVDTTMLAFNKETNGRFQMMITGSTDSTVRFPGPEIDPDLAAMPFKDVYLNEERDTLLGVEVFSNTTLKNALPAASAAEEVIPLGLIMPIAVDMNKNGRFDPLDYFIKVGT